MINPTNPARLYKASVHKVRPMYRTKFYLAAMQVQDKTRLLRDNRRYKTFTAAYVRAEKVLERWGKFCDYCAAHPLAVVMQSAQEPTA